MFKIRHILINTVVAITLVITPIIHAESVKYVQWWDEYLPQKFEMSGTSRGYFKKNQIQQYQDLDGDGVYNDTLVCKVFSMDTFVYPCQPNSGPKHKYRMDRPSARFYTGIVARYTNVSDITKDKKNEKIPIFDGFTQATIQPTEGAKPNYYDPDLPHNIHRAGAGEWSLGWTDATIWPIFNNWSSMAKVFQTMPEAEQNFSAIFMWKKEDFINGGSSVDKITFDKTSKLSVDITRTRKNVEEGRFIVQNGEQFWISEYVFLINADKPTTERLSPLDSRWAIYTPSDCDIEFNRENASFLEYNFEDVQAVGVYFATYYFTHDSLALTFDNFQANATSKPSPELPINNDPIGLAINSKGQPMKTDATFSRGISVNGGTVTVNSTDQMDIRGVITVDSKHVGKEADIFIVVSHTPVSTEKQSFFMFDKEGHILPLLYMVTS